jgi:hypothetical protein
MMVVEAPGVLLGALCQPSTKTQMTTPCQLELCGCVALPSKYQTADNELIVLLGAQQRYTWL